VHVANETLIDLIYFTTSGNHSTLCAFAPDFAPLREKTFRAKAQRRKTRRRKEEFLTYSLATAARVEDLFIRL